MVTQQSVSGLLIGLMVCSVIQAKHGQKNPPKKEKVDPVIQKYLREANDRPTKCQVCRVMVQELALTVNKTNKMKEKIWLTNRLDGEDKRDESKGKKIEYKKSELRMLEILESLCKKTSNYRSFPGPKFPYLRGVKSMFRQQLEETMAENKIGLTPEGPDEMVEDPTFEIKRLKFKCIQMIEEYEDDIMDWYMEAQDTDPIDYICADRILDPKSRSCLKAPTKFPADFRQPVPIDQGPNAKRVEL